MSIQDRRAFLIKLAKRTAYLAPVIATVAAPLETASAQHGKSSQHKHMHGHGMGHGMSATFQGPSPSPVPPAPWNRPPPGSP